MQKSNVQEERKKKKAYLKWHWKDLDEIKRLQDKLDITMLKNRTVAAYQLSNAPGNKQYHDISDKVVLIDELNRALIRAKTRYLNKYAEIFEAINKTDIDQACILSSKYLLRKNEKQLEKDMGVEKTTIYRLMNEALDKFEIPENTNF